MDYYLWCGYNLDPWCLFTKFLILTAQFTSVLQMWAPDWWLLWLDCSITICHCILISKIPIMSIAANSLKLNLRTILGVVHHILKQHRWTTGNPTWCPQGRLPV